MTSRFSLLWTALAVLTILGLGTALWLWRPNEPPTHAGVNRRGSIPPIAAPVENVSESQVETRGSNPQTIQPGDIPPEVLSMLQSPFEPSLHMREKTDFVLTPALLIQQLISKEAVVTYPEE